MIVTMEKVRILGPRQRLASMLALLQDVGAVHLCRPEVVAPVEPVSLTPREDRHRRALRRALEDAEEALAQLGNPLVAGEALEREPVRDLPRQVRFARRTRRRLARLASERAMREAERERLLHLGRLLEAFADLETIPAAEGMRVPAADGMRRFLLVLSGETEAGAERLSRALDASIGEAWELHTRPLVGGELAVALWVPEARAVRIEALLPEVGVRELELPDAFASRSTTASLGALRRQLDQISRDLAALAAERESIGRDSAPRLERARSAFHDALIRLEALGATAVTPHAFVIEGWLPERERARLEDRLAASEGETVVVESVAKETWSAEQVPVAIVNPRLFRPFEVITRWMPLPHYGTIDPTPFVAVFFPMFFGLILGDVGYACVLACLSLLIRWRSRPESLARSVAEIGIACAAFSFAFGLLFGELFGDLGRRELGLEPVAFSREEALVPFLALATALGFVHVLLGLVLGALSALRSDPRRSLGRGLAALMLLLSAAVVLAAVNLLPAAFFGPTVVMLLVLFPVLVAVEGTIAPIELLSRISNVLSYARIMALGTASVMLAMVANRLAGAVGSVVVGVLFAALFHVVNFALGVFSPTIHALRLHFVEFFGTFYSPGGQMYRPLRHWRPADAPAPQTA